MARKRYWLRRRPESPKDALAPLFGLLALGVVSYILTNRDQVLSWGFGILGACLIVGAVLLVLRKVKRQATLNWDDDKILYMLKGMSPAKFEQETAEMFRALYNLLPLAYIKQYLFATQISTETRDCEFVAETNVSAMDRKRPQSDKRHG